MKELTVAGIGKRYGSTVALDDVTISFQAGQVHAVLGENGAGKSTLVSVIGGFTNPDSGSMKMDGVDIPFGLPHASRRKGIAMVHQHFTLAPGLSAVENYALGQQGRLLSFFSPKQTVRELRRRSNELDWNLDPKPMAKDMAVGMQQRLEILKNIDSDSQVLIFDEPTSVLTPAETADLLAALKKFASEGKIVILIAHKLREVLSVSDRITVLRKGRLVGDLRASEASEANLAQLMLGETPDFRRTMEESLVTPGLTINNICVHGAHKNLAIDHLSLEVKRGEIIGIGGVDGNGQTELAEAIIGIRKPFEGEIRVANCVSPQLAYIPGDRHREGLALEMSLWENLSIGKTTGAGIKRGWLNISLIRKWARELLKRYNVKAKDELELASALSGGNQQKVVVGRELDRKPDFVIATNPTRGLDIKAAEYVRHSLRSIRNNGAGVLLISTDLDELAETANRVYFLSNGTLSAASDVRAMIAP